MGQVSWISPPMGLGWAKLVGYLRRWAKLVGYLRRWAKLVGYLRRWAKLVGYLRLPVGMATDSTNSPKVLK